MNKLKFSLTVSTVACLVILAGGIVSAQQTDGPNYQEATKSQGADTVTISGPKEANVNQPYEITIQGATSADNRSWHFLENGKLIDSETCSRGQQVTKTYSFTQTTPGDYTYVFSFRGLKGAHAWPEHTTVFITVKVGRPTIPVPTVITTTLVIQPFNYVRLGIPQDIEIKLKTFDGQNTSRAITVEVALKIQPDNQQSGQAEIKPVKITLTISSGKNESKPVKITIKGTQLSSEANDVALVASVTKASNTVVEPAETTRPFTVIHFDLAINRLKDAKENWGVSNKWQPLSEMEEEDLDKKREFFGGLVGLNGDDDDQNYNLDRDDTSFGNKENDAVPLDVSVTFPVESPVRLKLTNESDKIRVWRERDKALVLGRGAVSQELLLRDLSNTQPVAERFLVEGVDFSQVKNDITLILEIGGGPGGTGTGPLFADTVKLTVVGVEVRIKPTASDPSAGFIGLISASGKPAEMDKLVYVSQHPRVYAHVYTAGLLLQGTDDDVDLEIYSYDTSWKITNQQPQGTIEEYNAVSDDNELEPDRTNAGHYWNKLNDGGIWAVDDKKIEYDEKGGDESESVISVAGGEIVVRYWQDLPPWTGLRPPGWMMIPVSMDIVNPATERIDANNVAHIDTPAVAPGYNGNEFTYSVASPGVLTIPVRIQITPDTAEVRALFQDQIRVRVSAIDDSHSNPAGGNVRFVWNNPFAGEPTAGNAVYNATSQLWEATATFTGLPLNNTDFGRKNVMAVAEGTSLKCSDLTRCEVFFPRDAANHPGGVATDPNWFYYWGQVYVNTNVQYVAAADTGRTPAMTNWTYNAIPSKTRIEIGSGHPSKYKSYGIGEEASGIDRYVMTVIHEEKHVVQITAADALLPTSGTDSFRFGWSWNQARHNHWTKGPDGQWGVAGVDDDGNGIVDDAAAVPSFEPGNGDDVSLDNATWPWWPNTWPLPGGVYGTIHPIEGEAVKVADDAMNENDYAPQDWGVPGKNHKTANKWDD